MQHAPPTRLVGRLSPAVPTRREDAWTLVREAAGTPRHAATKLLAVGRAGWRLARYGDVRARLAALVAAGHVRAVPTRAQLVFGGFDMLRFLFEPGAEAHDRERGISPRMHRFLRVLGDPVSLLDPGGVTQTRDQVVRHLLENFHLNPIYDMQLLRTHVDGLDALERECRALLDGSHPDRNAIQARIPDPQYHAALIDYAQRLRRDSRAPAPRMHSHDSAGSAPDLSAEQQAAFQAAVRQLSDLWGFVSYCHSLPAEPLALLRRARTLDRFPVNGETR